MIRSIPCLSSRVSQKDFQVNKMSLSLYSLLIEMGRFFEQTFYVILKARLKRVAQGVPKDTPLDRSLSGLLKFSIKLSESMCESSVRKACALRKIVNNFLQLNVEHRLHVIDCF